jgi:hypothetical protein
MKFPTPSQAAECDGPCWQPSYDPDACNCGLKEHSPPPSMTKRPFIQGLDQHIDWNTVAIALVLIVFLGGGLWAAIENEKNWQQFAEDNNCRVVEKIRGATGTGFVSGYTGSSGSAGGIVTTTEPDRTVYICDDGVRYTR